MCLRPVYLRSQGIAVPCGKCFECNVQRARAWAFRIALEARQYKHCCMVTLTYNDEHLPLDRSVSVREIQLFIKRLRKKIYPLKIRYFGCGEYGERRGRPHYHVIIFGYDFSDRYFFKNDNKGTPLFLSPMLQRLWSVEKIAKGKKIYESIGYSSVVDVTYDTAKYVAIYLQKPPVDGRARPFTVKSTRPGLAFSSIKPELLKSDKLYLNGKYISLPRYFLSVLERQGYDILPIKEKRLSNARQAHLNYLADTSAWFKERNNKIRKIERIFGKRLDKNLMV